MDAIHSKFMTMPTAALIQYPGEKDVVDGRACALFNKRLKNGFESEYLSESDASKKNQILSQAFATLHGEGFRFLTEVDGGGFRTVDWASSIKKIRKRIQRPYGKPNPKRPKVDDAAAPLPLERGLTIGASDEWDIQPGHSRTHPASAAYLRKLSDAQQEFSDVRHEAGPSEHKLVICAKVYGELTDKGFRFVEGNGGVMERDTAIMKIKRSLMDMTRTKKEKEEKILEAGS